MQIVLHVMINLQNVHHAKKDSNLLDGNVEGHALILILYVNNAMQMVNA